MKISEVLWLVLLTVVTATLGGLYAIYKPHPHHWGFIAGTVLDSNRGLHLFSQTYVQYGVGQALLFKLLHYVLPVNYTSIGIFTAFVYALSIVVLYLGTRKLAGSVLAILISLAGVLLHSFAIYPWPDYYAGLCLMVACYLMIGPEDGRVRTRHLLAGAFLFLAFLFRNTYLVNLVPACLVMALISVFWKPLRNTGLLAAILVFLLLTAAYMVLLQLEGNLNPWYRQTIGVGSALYGTGSNSILPLLQNAFLLHDLPFACFTGLFYVGLRILLALLFRRRLVRREDIPLSGGTLAFFCLAGLAGICQNANQYEIFRLQNACSPLYLVLAYYLAAKVPSRRLRDVSADLKLVGVVLLVSLAVRFPNASSIFPIFQHSLKDYSESRLAYFRWHRFSKDENAYYDGLSKLLCDGRSRIVNLTSDSTIPYLCMNQRNSLALPFYHEALLTIIDPARIDEVTKGQFQPDEIVVSINPVPRNPKVKLIEIGRVRKPETIRFMGAAMPVMVFRVGP
jgi:hypothetical protein